MCPVIASGRHRRPHDSCVTLNRISRSGAFAATTAADCAASAADAESVASCRRHLYNIPNRMALCFRSFAIINFDLLTFDGLLC